MVLFLLASAVILQQLLICLGVFQLVEVGATVDIVAVLTAEHTVTGERGVSGQAGVCVLRAGVIPEDHTPGSLDVPAAVRALDNTALRDVGISLIVDATACPVDLIAGVRGLGGFGGGLFSRLRSGSLGRGSRPARGPRL